MSREETAPLLETKLEQEQKSGAVGSFSALLETDVQVEVNTNTPSQQQQQQQQQDGDGTSGEQEQQGGGHHHRHHRSASTFLVSLLSFLSAGGSDDDDQTPRQKRRRNRHRGRRHRLHHTDSVSTKLFLLFVYIFIVCYSFIITLGPLYLSFLPKSSWCEQWDEQTTDDGESSGNNAARDLFSGDSSHPVRNEQGETIYANPDYNMDPCRRQPVFPILAGMTLEDCDISRRMLVAVVLGAVVGYERRSADRPAGIRTMGLVSLGSCFFTICSIMAFKSSTMAWDASRVTAALPSGVGFLGGALIWKGSVFVDGSEQHQVHGLTTAASLWLSAAIGVGAGGALYAVTIYTTVLVLIVLRYGPSIYLQPELDEELNESNPKGDDSETMHHQVNLEAPQDITTSIRRSRRSIPSFKG